MTRKLALASLVLAFAGAAHAQNNLQAALGKLDQASTGFKNAQADVHYDQYTAVIRAHDAQTGQMYIERSGKTSTMGAVFFDPGQSNPARVVNYDGKILQVYTPGTNQNDVFSAQGNQARLETFLTLGFGGSGKDLAAAWNITDQGSETVSGTRTEKLDLVSKDPSVSNTIKHVTIWIDLSRGVSLRQQFFQSNGDIRTADYSNIRENQSVNKKPFAIAKGAQVVHH